MMRLYFPLSSWLATLMYLRPAACASCSAEAMLLPVRTLDKLDQHRQVHAGDDFDLAAIP